VVAPQPDLVTFMSRMNILGSVTADDLSGDPFAHLVRKPALPDDLYAERAASFPDQALILGARRSRENASARLPAFKALQDGRIAQIWRAFFEFHTSAGFWPEIVRVFGTALRDTFPDIEARAGRPLNEWIAGSRRVRTARDALDLRLDCQFVINTPAKQASSVKTQHVDKLTTIIAMLYYFRDPGDLADGGDLQFYSWNRPPRFLTHRMALPSDLDGRQAFGYSPNLLVGFVNSARAVHGVSPRAPSVLPRRYVNFIVEIPFKAFDPPKLGVAQRVWHWPETRKLNFRDVGRDRY
jgi:hypothetical protein